MLWSASVGAPAARLAGAHSSHVTALAWCADAAAPLLASGCGSGGVVLWDVRAPGAAAAIAAPRLLAAPWEAAPAETIHALAFCAQQPAWLAVARSAGVDVYDTRMLASPAQPLPLRAWSPAEEHAAAEECIVAHAPCVALAATTALAWWCAQESSAAAPGADVALWVGDAAGRVRRLEVGRSA
jgi:hypothetical protein